MFTLQEHSIHGYTVRNSKKELCAIKERLLINRFVYKELDKTKYIAKPKGLWVLKSLNDFIVESRDKKLCGEIYFDNMDEYRIVWDGVQIEIYQQRGRELGLFINTKQVGLVSKVSKSKLGKDIYKISLDRGLPSYIVFLFVSIYNRQVLSYNDDTLIDKDYGHVNIKPVLEIQKNWRPL